MIEARISEVERRQNHISKIDPNHILVQVALDCLRDEDVERPTAQQLCERVAALKEETQYCESVRAGEIIVQGRSDEQDRELRSLRQQHSQQVQGLQQIIQSQTRRLAEKDQILQLKDETIAAAQQQLRQKIDENRQQEREKNQIIKENAREIQQKWSKISRLERQLGRVNQQLEESERVNAQFQKQIVELEQLRPATNTTQRSKEQNRNIKLIWRKGEKAPCEMSYHHCGAVHGSTLYVRASNIVYGFNISTCRWSRLPDSPTTICPSVIINNLLTLVGGLEYTAFSPTNQLFSLTGKGSGRRWTEEFPPMPTKRRGSTALCTGTTLIVAGGEQKTTVEVLNTETLQWFIAADLPQQVSEAPAAVCGDQIYILGQSTNIMYTCSVLALIQSCQSRLKKGCKETWKEVAAPLVTATTCVSIHGRLLTIGGRGSDEKITTAIHKYNPTTDSWEVISHMGIPRHYCIAAVLPNNQLMVVGGRTGPGIGGTDSVKFTTIE